MVPSQDIFPEEKNFSSENVLGVSNQLLVSVVIPTLNEAENLPYLLPRIPLWVHEVVLVDGLSTDNTVEVARRLLPSVRIVYQQGRGKGNALLTGFAAATGDIIIALDADGSQNPAEMITFVGALLAGYDYAKGSRFLQGGGTTDMGAYRFLGNWLLMRLVRLLFGGRYTDLCYGYNAFWKNVLSQLQLRASGFEIEAMMNVHALMAGLKVVEVPSFEAKRIHGDSHLRTIPDGWRVLKLILKSRLKNGHGPVVPHMGDSPFGHSVQYLTDSTFSLCQREYSNLCPTCGNRLHLDLPKRDDILG